jgi:hypothetical protein
LACALEQRTKHPYNDGTRLLLLGGDDRPEFALPAVTRFAFVRER